MHGADGARGPEVAGTRRRGRGGAARERGDDGDRRESDEVSGHVACLTADQAEKIGAAAYRRVLAEHTYANRALQVEQILNGSFGIHRSALSCRRSRAAANDPNKMDVSPPVVASEV